MDIKNQLYFNRKLRNLLWVLFNRIENNNNGNFNSNGEKCFINSFFRKNVNSDLTLFDIGANIGSYTEMLLNLSAKHNINASVHVFEPTSGCFEVLEKKFLNKKQVSLNNLAVSDSEGKADIYFDQAGSTLASLYHRDLDNLNVSLNNKEVVDLVRLDSYIKLKNINHINLIKIDTEGHDLAGLLSLGTYLHYNFIDFIQFEYGGTTLDARASLKDFYKLLEPAGFVICKIKPGYLEQRAYHHIMENFNYANYVAVSKQMIEKVN